MDKVFKLKWVHALRSGDYQQCHAVLERLDPQGKAIGNCCLGVALRIEGIAEQKKNVAQACTVFDGMHSMPSREFYARTGLTPMISSQLAAMNDKGKTFAEIADYIEQNL